MTRATVHNGQFVFSSPLAKYRFMQEAEGKDVKLEIFEKPTTEMRKYFEGCLVPAFFYFHPSSGWKSFADAREILKLEFAPGRREIATMDGSEVMVAPSTTDMSKERFTAFVETVTQWMMENGMPYDVLDSEAYKQWRDSNFTDIIYPPLGRLKEHYDSIKKSV